MSAAANQRARDLETARGLLADIHTLYGGAGTFTNEQLDEYATGAIVTALDDTREEGRQQERADVLAHLRDRPSSPVFWLLSDIDGGIHVGAAERKP